MKTLLLLGIFLTIVQPQPPSNLHACLTINFNNLNGVENHSLFLIDPNTKKLYNFAFEELTGPGTPIYGQPMHASIHPGNEYIHVSVGGTNALPLRIYTVKMDWSNQRKPTAKVVDLLDIVPAGVLNNVDFYCPMQESTCAYQEAHGLWEFEHDGRNYLGFSVLTNYKVGIIDITDVENPFLHELVEHESLITPHGLYPNPSGTMAMSTQYAYSKDEVSIWMLGPDPVFMKTMQLYDQSEDVHGAFSHVGVWLDDGSFLTSSNHESTDDGNGIPGGVVGVYEAGIWHCEITKNQCTVIIREETDQRKGALAAVSDFVIAKGKLFTAEGMFLQGAATEGHIAIWDIESTGCSIMEPCFNRRHSGGASSTSSSVKLLRKSGEREISWPVGLKLLDLESSNLPLDSSVSEPSDVQRRVFTMPADYFDTHEICNTDDEKWVIAASFQAGYVIQIDAETGDIARVYGHFRAGKRMSLPHGSYCR